ncbi:hypothetical protein Taro_010565 [Colocasia esculenta]|uniref:Uncharacterized protein n=1 Tax=Colocasia esculenta TaxID=4460 RepID=A0A843U7A3_COLES|nr:hypothetical protein [Colocasia esculenta]
MRNHAHVIYIYDIYIYAFNGVLYLHWACIQQVMYMDVDDRVFVPPSDVYMGNMPLRMSSVTPGDLEQEPRRMSFYDTGGLEYVPQRMSFYDTGGLKHMPRRMSFYDTGGLKHMPRRGSRNNLWRLYGASAEGPGHGDKAPTGVDTCGLCKLAHGPAEVLTGGSAVFLTSGPNGVYGGRMACWKPGKHPCKWGYAPLFIGFVGGHTGGGTLPGGGARARASRTGASAEAARQRGTDRRGCALAGVCTRAGEPAGVRHPAEPAGVRPLPGTDGGAPPRQEPAGVPPPGPPINGVGLHSLAISSSSSGRELCGPPVPGSLVDGRAVHVHACIVRASPAIPRAFVPVFEGHVHFIVLDALGSCAALNEDLVTGFPLSEVRFVPSRRCFGRALHSELVTSVVPGSPRVPGKIISIVEKAISSSYSRVTITSLSFGQPRSVEGSDESGCHLLKATTWVSRSG